MKNLEITTKREIEKFVFDIINSEDFGCDFTDPIKASRQLESGVRSILDAFYEEVNRRACDNMMLTGKLEGSHHAAMIDVLNRLGMHKANGRNPGDGQKL